jgi:signal transduction histidine kinase
MYLGTDAMVRGVGAGDCEKAEKRSDELYALANSLAHEIRNPLNALSLNLNLLKKYVGESEQASKQLEAAQKEVARLDELLSGFLRFARPKDARPRKLRLAAALGELETFIAPEAKKRGVRLELAVKNGIEAETDGNLLKQSLLNILLNSFETGASRVTLSAAEENGEIVITVVDDGPGFAEPDRVFEPFYSTKPEGTGLGLPTSRAIIRALGGDLRLGATKAGAEIVITIPKASP